jgi:hypothetical protein
MDKELSFGEQLLQAALEGEKTRKTTLQTEDLIVLCEDAISNLEDIRATLVNLGD